MLNDTLHQTALWAFWLLTFCFELRHADLTYKTHALQSALLPLENWIFKYKVVIDIKNMSTEIDIDSGNSSVI